MAHYSMKLVWQRQQAPFLDKRYSRGHTWSFDGGVQVPASSSPHVVPEPYSVAANVDPEEAFVAALASCHMLTFLWLAAQQGLIVDAYEDAPVGEMEPNPRGQLWLARLTLHPRIRFGSAALVTEAVVAQLHHAAHEQCYLANSVLTRIEVAGSWEVSAEC